MAEENTTASATPPATSGGLTEESVGKLLKDALSGVVTKFEETITGLKGELKAVKDAAASALKPADIAKAVSDQLTATQKTAADADAAKAKKLDLRKAAIEKNLKGVPDGLINLPDSDDPAVLDQAAASLRTQIEGLPGVKLADIGGVANSGGTPPAAEKKTADAGGKYNAAIAGSDGMATYMNTLDGQIAALNKQ